MYRGIFGLLCVRHPAREDVHETVGDAEVPRSLHLQAIFELVADGLGNGPLMQEQLFRNSR